MRRVSLGRRIIEPLRITAFDEIDLPLSFPRFTGFFPRDRRHHAFMGLVPYESVNTITARETRQYVILVLPDPFR